MSDKTNVTVRYFESAFGDMIGSELISESCLEFHAVFKTRPDIVIWAKNISNHTHGQDDGVYLGSLIMPNSTMKYLYLGVCYE